MTACDPTSGSPPPELLLAALDRAERHSTRPEPGVLPAEVIEHLGQALSPAADERVRVGLESLKAAGQAVRARRYGMTIWTPTDAGREQLTKLQATVAALPESPQHRAWRDARQRAADRFGGFRQDLEAGVAHGSDLLASEQPVESEGWYKLGEWLDRACRRLGAATHCLTEWDEPDDATADIDPSPRRGRRHIPS